MDLNKIGLIAGINKRMAWLNQRMQVLSQNIANSDTPGYIAQEMKPQSFRELVNAPKAPGIGMATTQSGHIVARPSGSSAMSGETKNKGGYEAVPTGNTVVLEEQMMKMAESQSEYRMLTNLYRKNVDLLKTALGR